MKTSILNSKSVVETGDHRLPSVAAVKNGASPKSQMSRGNFVETIILVAIFIFTCFSGHSQYYGVDYNFYNQLNSIYASHYNTMNEALGAMKKIMDECTKIEKESTSTTKTTDQVKEGVRENKDGSKTITQKCLVCSGTGKMRCTVAYCVGGRISTPYGWMNCICDKGRITCTFPHCSGGYVSQTIYKGVIIDPIMPVKDTGKTVRVSCTFCNGTGKSVEKIYPPRYTSSTTYMDRPCEICGDRESHTHKLCPCCNGLKYAEKWVAN